MVIITGEIQICCFGNRMPIKSILFLLLNLFSLCVFAQPPIKQPYKPEPPKVIKPEPPKTPKPVTKSPSGIKPKPNPNNGIKEITVLPFENYTSIQYQYTGSSEVEALGDTTIIGIQLLPNTKYKLWVKTETYIHPVYNVETERFVLYKQIEPVAKNEINPNFPEGIEVSTGKLPFNYTLPNGTIYPSYYDIILTETMVYGNAIKIKKANENEYKLFTKNIYGFTFMEGHRYILEAEQIGNDYKLIKIIDDKKYLDVSNPTKIEYPASENDANAGENKKTKLNPKVGISNTPAFKINSLEGGYWYLRYLFIDDDLKPINDLLNTSYVITFDTWKKICTITTPCNDFDAHLISNDVNFFNFYDVNKYYTSCDQITQLLFEKLKLVNQYSVIDDNKLKLSKDGKDLIWFERRRNLEINKEVNTAKETAEAINDRDGDGIFDEEDDCPDVFGSLTAQGCPDRDGDGVSNDKDNCPDVAGLASNKGCPELIEEVKKKSSFIANTETAKPAVDAVQSKTRIQQLDVWKSLYPNNTNFDNEKKLIRKVKRDGYDVELRTEIGKSFYYNINGQRKVIVILFSYSYSDGVNRDECHVCRPEFDIAHFSDLSGNWAKQSFIENWSDATGSWGNADDIYFETYNNILCLKISGTYGNHGTFISYTNYYDIETLKKIKSIEKTLD